ncbi:helix-turn-helix transcriptional regulator [Parabacteroides chinchillae]|uniref:helix-turn-helix transcriptional regulator n=1 Tax=Parabacteroides chinchillae TaxID=871327 RepID=UPI001358472E
MKQGKNTVEIASDLCKGQYTVRNQIKSLFSKLKVHSMQEAIKFVCYLECHIQRENKT